MSYQNSNNVPQNDNDYFEEDENLNFLPADHPLMARLQVALRKTLEDDHEKTHLLLQEREAKIKKLEKEKESVAVELYEVQQSLAEMHLNLEQTHHNYNLIQKLRVEAEQKLSILNQQFESKKGHNENLEKNVLKAQDELSKLTNTLKQVEEYNQQIANEIANTKRTTYRAEENIEQQEKMKKHQDFLIDHLNEQKKKLHEQMIIIEAQLLAQKDETKSAKDILREAFTEMENIIVSKRNLLDRWQKSLLEMQRRDKALQVAREALKVQYEINVQITSELNGVGNDIKKESKVSETLAAGYNRLKLEERQLDDERAKLEHEMSRQHAQIKILQQSLQSTETSIAAVEKEIKKVDEQMISIEDSIMKIHTQAKDLYEQVIVKINEHKTLEKSSANLLRQTQIIYQEIEEKEIEKEGVDNEVARVDLDSLNTRNQLELLRKREREVSEERKKKEATVSEYELEIRQGHDINSKKQGEVGKLNKLHDELVNNSSEMSRAPLDAHRNHLLNSIKERSDQVQLLEKDWIKKQTALVKQQQNFSKYSEECGTLQTKKTILEQKKMRLNTNYQTQEREIREIKIALKNLGTEMNKLNDGISNNQSAETKLKNENFNVQSEFMTKLKELESNNVKLEIEIDRTKEDKAELLTSIVEAERQLLLWERKIQLEKEIQSALDPEIGQSEIKLLKKEIHRMELRLEELRKKQEFTIQEMERAVSKREVIQVKYIKNEDPAEKKGAKETQARVHKQIETLKTTLSQTTKNNKEYDKKLKELQSQIDQRSEIMNGIGNTTKQLETELNGNYMDLNQMRIERIAGIFDIVRTQTIYKAYDSIATNKFKVEASGDLLRQKYHKQREMNMKMLDVLNEIADANSDYQNVFRGLTSIRLS